MTLSFYQAAELQKRHLITPEMQIKLYSPSQIAAATFLGGLIAATLLFSANFLALKQKLKALLSLIIGFLIVYIINELPNYIELDWQPDYIIILSVLGAWLVTHFWQISYQEIIKNDQYQLQPHFSALRIGLTLLLVELGLGLYSQY